MRKIKYLGVFLALGLCGCSISFQNVMTSGKAQDLIDETQTTTPDVDAAVDIPAVGL